MLNKIKAIYSSNYIPFILALAINFLLHLPFLTMPPEGVHVWRQCNTLSIARNFHEEGMNILEPKVDNRYNKSGVTGANFPAYEWGLAVSYKFFGEKFWVHRVYTMTIFFIGISGFFLLLLNLFNNYVIANSGAIALLFFPDLFYFEILALPDILSLSCTIWGFYFFIRWFKAYKKQENTFLLFITSALLLALAGLVKLYFLLIGFAIAGIILQEFRLLFSLKMILYIIGFAIISVGIPIAWYIYAVELIKKSGLADFGLEVRTETDIDLIIKTLAQNIISDLPELILNFANTIILLCGCYFFFKKKAYKKRFFIPALCLFIAIIMYHFMEMKQMHYHSYYMMPYYPFLACIVAYGANQLWVNKWGTILILLIILNPLIASIRILPSRWLNDNKAIPMELYNESTRTQLIQAIPNNNLCIVGEDQSKCIDYYFLHKKGFGFTHWQELLKKNRNQIRIERYINQGAEYIYFSDKGLNPEDTPLKHYLGKLIIKVGDIYVYQLKR